MYNDLRSALSSDYRSMELTEDNLNDIVAKHGRDALQVEYLYRNYNEGRYEDYDAVPTVMSFSGDTLKVYNLYPHMTNEIELKMQHVDSTIETIKPGAWQVTKRGSK